MTRIVIREIVWDAWNREHIKKHDLTEREIRAGQHRLVFHKRSYAGRYLAIVRSGTRLVALVLQRVGQTRYYLVTARDADKKERRGVYEKEKQNP